MGSEDKGFYFVYDPAVAAEHRRHAAFNQGNKSLLERKSRNTAFMKAVKFLCELLLRKRCVKRGGGFYSVEACWRLTRRKFPEWTVCLATVWNWIKAGRFAEKGITPDTVRIWKRRTKQKRIYNKENWKIRNAGHTIFERPAVVESLMRPMDLEGDLMESVTGDSSAVLSIISRSSSRQWFEKIASKTERAVHGALRRIVERMKAEGLLVETITFDNGVCFRNTARLEAIVAAGRKAGGRIFYAEPYHSGQRGRNERNHALARRFTGQNLHSLTPSKLREIEDFLNDYPRGKFAGKSAREEFAWQAAGNEPSFELPPAAEERGRIELASAFMELARIIISS